MTGPQSWFYEAKWNSFRRSGSSLALSWDGGRASVALYDIGAPRTAAAILAALPLTMPVIHAAWSGEMVVASDSYALGQDEFENEVRLVRPGDLGWDPKFGEITVTYGTAECKLPSGPNNIVVFGQISEGLEDFARWARATRFRGVGNLTLDRLAQ